MRNNTSSATQGEYVYAREAPRLSGGPIFIEWTVSVTTAGPYLISVRYAHDHDGSKPWNVFVNSQEIKRQDYNPNDIINFNNIGSNPTVELGRCDGDCDSSTGDCAPGLFCMQYNNLLGEVPGCTGTRNSGWDYCLDAADFDNGFMLLPTGGWDDDWFYSEPLTVNLTGECAT